MALENYNPEQTKAWELLKNHYYIQKETSLSELFRKDEDRKDKFTIHLEDLCYDYSKNLISDSTKELLLSLLPEVNFKEAIEKYFTGDIINVTEERAVLHTGLRSNSDTPIFVDGKDVKPKIKTAQRKIKAFTNKVLSGKWKGYTGKAITDVVNVGIGGSDLGSNMVVDALKFYKTKLRTHFISNVDGDHLQEVLKVLDPETTLFIIVSKSFTTEETLTNANTIRDWFLKSATIFDVAKHFIAVSSNTDLVVNFGIDKKNIFPIWNWVGGRFSLWSSAGLIISLAIGFANFKELLDGAECMDNHFRNANYSENIPVMMALLSLWYNNFYGFETEAVFGYTKYLDKFVDYLQQASMESNGKGVDRNGEPITYQTGSVLWGGVGTNIQHSFMQLLHQGTKIIPADFIGFTSSLYGEQSHHSILMANFYAQTEALAFGKSKEQVHLDLKIEGELNRLPELLPYKVFNGNRPSTTIIFDKLTPKALGMLTAMYEHKVFTLGVLWNIYSFDQFGVELGKELAQKKSNTY